MRLLFRGERIEVGVVACDGEWLMPVVGKNVATDTFGWRTFGCLVAADKAVNLGAGVVYTEGEDMWSVYLIKLARITLHTLWE